MFYAVRGQRIPLKEIGRKKITEISLDEFSNSVKTATERKENKKKTRIHETNNRRSPSYIPSYKRETTSGSLYDTFEYGMSDW